MKYLGLVVLNCAFLFLLFHANGAQDGTDYCPTGTEIGCANVTCPDKGSTPPFSCPIGYPDDLYPNPYDCCTFYKCVTSNFYCYDCPDDLVYDGRTKECKFYYEVPGCNTTTWCADVTLRPGNATTTPTTPTTTTTRTTTTRSTTTTTTPPTTTTTVTTTRSPKPTLTRPCEGCYFECPDDQPDGVFPITPDTCNEQFYRCIDGYPSIATCPSGVFDPNLLICVPRNESTCAFTCPAENGFFPIPDQCTGAHYVCVSYVAYNQTCPGTSIFDPKTGLCLSQTNPNLCCTPGGSTANCKNPGTINLHQPETFHESFYDHFERKENKHQKFINKERVFVLE